MNRVLLAVAVGSVLAAMPGAGRAASEQSQGREVGVTPRPAPDLSAPSRALEALVQAWSRWDTEALCRCVLGAARESRRMPWPAGAPRWRYRVAQVRVVELGGEVARLWVVLHARIAGRRTEEAFALDPEIVTLRLLNSRWRVVPASVASYRSQHHGSVTSLATLLANPDLWRRSPVRTRLRAPADRGGWA